jgi:hypothetical protein
MTSWLVTIRLDESRTRDITIRARSYYARWLYRNLNPQHTILAVRPARGYPWPTA